MNSRPAVRGDGQAGEPQSGPLPSSHRLRDEGQGQRRGGEKTEENLEDKHGRLRKVLGEQPGHERAKRRGAGVRGGGHQRCAPCGGFPAHLGERRGGSTDHQAGGHPGQDPGRVEPAGAGGEDEQDGAGGAETQGGGHHRPSARLIRSPAGQQQGGEHGYRVNREDQREDPRGEMPLTLVDGIQRGRQGGTQHDGGEHVGDQPECDSPRHGAPVQTDRRLSEAVGAGPVRRPDTPVHLRHSARRCHTAARGTSPERVIRRGRPGLRAERGRRSK